MTIGTQSEIKSFRPKCVLLVFICWQEAMQYVMIVR